MSSPFVRRSTAITAGAVVLAGLVAAPVASFAAAPAGLAGVPDDAVNVTADPDGTGELYTLTQDVRTFATITMPNDATLDGAGHTITAVEDVDHPNFPGPVLASAVGDDSAPAELDVKNLHMTTEGFENGSNSNGLLNGIYLYRAGGSLTNVSVDGISHGNGVQEGNAISIRNRVTGDDINVPSADVTLAGIHVSNFQKTGLLLDGNLTFVVRNAHVGQGAGPQGQPNPTMGANSLQISRGASGSVANSSFKLNSNVEAAAALLYNAKTVDFDRVTINGDAPATTGIGVWDTWDTIHTTFTMRGGEVTRTAPSAADTEGMWIDGPEGAITATVTDTAFAGWSSSISGDLATRTKVDVSGQYAVSRPHARQLRVDLQASKLGGNQVEAKALRWTIKVDGHRAAVTRQHAGDTDTWAQRFSKGTGRHTVEIIKNGVSQHTYKVHTR